MCWQPFLMRNQLIIMGPLSANYNRNSVIKSFLGLSFVDSLDIDRNTLSLLGYRTYRKPRVKNLCKLNSMICIIRQSKKFGDSNMKKYCKSIGVVEYQIMSSSSTRWGKLYNPIQLKTTTQIFINAYFENLLHLWAELPSQLEASGSLDELWDVWLTFLLISLSCFYCAYFDGRGNSWYCWSIPI